MKPPRAPPRRRRDGWTPLRQRLFLAALADCGTVRDAAAHIGISRQSLYKLRRHPGAADFVAAWDAALADFRARQWTLADP